MGSQCSRSQLQTLERHGVRAVTICLDPDGAGKKGTLACAEGLYASGINAFVAPVLPDGNDPDEYVLEHGLDAWRAHIEQAEHAFRYQARSIVRAHKGEAWTEADKWRIGQMKELRDGRGSANTVQVISEARKPTNDAQGWASDMASIMGAARGIYTPDMVLLLNPLSDQELGRLDGDKGNDEAGKKIREREAEEGFARQRLSIVKGRDGVQRGRVDLRFHFRQSRFEEEGLGKAPLRHARRREHATA
jgi:DNA primase